MEIYIAIGIIGILVGIVFGKVVSNHFLNKTNKFKINQAHKKASDLIKDADRKAENIKKNRIRQAKEKFKQLKIEHEKVIFDRQKKIVEIEKSAKAKEQKLNQSMEQCRLKEKSINSEIEKYETLRKILNKKQKDLQVLHTKYIESLEKISEISVEEAKNQLIEGLKQEAKTESMVFIKNTVEEAKLTANTEVKKLLLGTLQRIGVEQTIENTVSTFNIKSDDIKGRIIGKEGRNIRALEAVTGAEIIVDDTPETIIISCFDPLRREVARLSLEKLVSDGRIHPARIEDIVKKVEKDIKDEIVETGKKTVIELGIHGLHPQLIKMVGRMKYRSSYGQNLLQHSKEVARLSSTMTAEFGLNSKLAKRAGLLHDIGKVSEEENEMPHALLGMELAEKYGETPEVCNAIGAHHEEIEMNYMISPIIQVCDAISGARPGARRQVAESYIKRLKELEELALSYDGVTKTYAIQAGRET